MKLKALPVLLLALVPVLAAAGEERLRLNSALESYRARYVTAKLHKAFAQSPNGAWHWVQDRTSADMAARDALDGCNAHLKGGEDRCTIINLDDKWIP
jgi:hypothetical protein